MATPAAPTKMPAWCENAELHDRCGCSCYLGETPPQRTAELRDLQPGVTVTEWHPTVKNHQMGTGTIALPPDRDGFVVIKETYNDGTHRWRTWHTSGLTVNR